MEDLEASYQRSLDFLYSFVDHSLTRNLRYSAEKFNLGRMERFASLLGDPQQDYRIIHVAGTKGKGSVSAMTASALSEAGYKVGSYTSPHLQEYTERIQIDGVQIGKGDLVSLVEKIRPLTSQVENISTFELTTALAFQYFAEQKVDLAVIEVGLGGRLDATNIVQPLVTAITSLSLDHMNVLGNTLAKIAFEKGGIIKPGRPLVISPQKEEAQLVLESICAERGSRMVRVGRDFLYAHQDHSLDGQSFYIWTSGQQDMMTAFIEGAEGNTWRPLNFHIPLLGFHQIENGATAYAILDTLRAEGITISDQNIQSGFSRVKWPGRFEVISRNPLVIVDSAHNRDSALRLRIAIDDYLPGVPVILVFGASEDKDIHGMFTELLPRIDRLVATQSSHPRAMSANKLVELAHTFGTPALETKDLPDALYEAIHLACHGEAIVVAGSLFVAAAARECWPQFSKRKINS